jgi:hypothetical protein
MTSRHSERFLVHRWPVWREKADFILRARLEKLRGRGRRWEQLWARQLGENRFEICCIPFFVYDLALGDEVETGLKEKTRYVIERVVRPSGHYTFRVWFGNSRYPGCQEEVLGAMARFNCTVEWSSQNLLAIDSAPEVAQAVADYLYNRQLLGHLEYETGRTK